MYTRCPSCSCTFRVTATLLQMAEGEVRCGSCGAVFNALRTLIDDWSGADFTLPETPRLTSETPDTPAPESLEFNVPEDEWQRFFIPPEEEAPARPDPGLGEDFEAPADPGPPEQSPDDTAEHPLPPRSVEEETADTDTWRAFLREAEGEPEADKPLFVIGEETARAGEVEILIRRPSGRGSEPAPAAEPATSGADYVEPGDVDRDLPAGEAPEPDFPVVGPDDVEEAEPASPETVLDWGGPPPFMERVQRPLAHTGRWLAASAAAALLLGGQLLHHYRDTLAADAAYGPAVRSLYARLGEALYPAWPLEAYEMRDSKAIAEKSAPGALDIVAEIAVTGRQPVGLPMVRVVLRDRWSSPVASGVFEPGQYLAGPQAQSKVYAPGSLIPVEISLKDPGSAAQGFEVDVCIPDRKLGLQCKSARDPFQH
jgi:predicted Zn finger-like uncharacterized protein